MAIPLSFAHLVKITCMRAGNAGGPEQRECWSTLGAKHVGQFWDNFKNANDREGKNIALSALINIRFGGQANKLKDLIYGKMAGETAEMRTNAVWAAGWDAMFNGGINYFMPVFANQQDSHDVRLAALTMIMHSKPTTTDMSRIMAVLKTEKDYEVMNYAYTLFEQYANNINPCFKVKCSEFPNFQISKFLKFLEIKVFF
jgi:hypothetical protein